MDPPIPMVDGTDLQIGFASHGSCCNCCTAETEKLLLYVCGNAGVVSFLNIMTIDTECRQAFLCVGSQEQMPDIQHPVSQYR